MLKLMGAVFIVVACTWLGFYLAQRLRERTEQIRELQMVLQMLETEITYASTPLTIAFGKISKKNEGLISLLFDRCLYYLQEKDGATTYESWQAALEDIGPQLSLKQAELSWLEHFGQIVGGSDRNDQRKHIHLLITHLQQIESEAVEAQKKHEKMYKALGFLTGILIVILLI